MHRIMQGGRFHGAPLGTRRFGALTVSEKEYTPGHELPLHAHENAFFSLLLGGAFRERVGQKERECLATSLVYYPALEPHTESFDDGGGRALNIDLGPSWVARVEELGLAGASGSIHLRRSRANWLATRVYGEFREDEDAASLAIEELVLNMLVEVADESAVGNERREPRWLGDLVDRLHEEFLDPPSVVELASEAEVHPVHLARVFRARHGCTLAEYVRRLRIEYACAALSTTVVPLSTLALDMGFSDQAHFTRRFKEVTGLTPGSYRTRAASR